MNIAASYPNILKSKKSLTNPNSNLSIKLPIIPLIININEQLYNFLYMFLINSYIKYPKTNIVIIKKNTLLPSNIPKAAPKFFVYVKLKKFGIIFTLPYNSILLVIKTLDIWSANTNKIINKLTNIYFFFIIL